jgi:hypothetical protein
MANIDTYLKGDKEDSRAVGELGIYTYTGVADLSELATAGFASGDVARLVELPNGAIVIAVDAEITEALVNVANTDLGNTISSSTDPDDYIDAQTNSAVGRFTTYTAAATSTAVLTADTHLALSFVTSGTPTGKVAWSITFIAPAKDAKGIAAHRTYPN